MTAALPQLHDHLPDLCAFVATQAHEVENGNLRDGDALALRIREFYAPERMHAIDRVVPGWTTMAAYADGATLVHVTQVMIALQLLPEYRQATEQLRYLLDWTVLQHDLGKQVIKGQRDALHAFRGATMAARALPGVGFPTTEAYTALLDPWTRRVLAASVAAPDGKGLVQDSRALPDILRGAEQLFGVDSAAALIVQAVLLHQSLDVVPDWPNPGSVTEVELARSIRPALVPLLEAMMLVDSDAWQLFDPDSKARFRESTLAVFATLRRQVGA